MSVRSRERRQGEEEGLEGRLHSRPHLRGRFAIISKAKNICQQATLRQRYSKPSVQTRKPRSILTFARREIGRDLDDVHDADDRADPLDRLAVVRR